MYVVIASKRIDDGKINSFHSPMWPSFPSRYVLCELVAESYRMEEYLRK
jgi:hypothetical protein